MDVVKPKVLERLKDIDFGCNWQDGTCTAMRKRAANSRRKQIGMICCRSCAHYKGYLRTKELPTEYVEYFDNKLGFWREGVGCILPKEMRSRRCLVYVCQEAECSQADREILVKLEFDL